MRATQTRITPLLTAEQIAERVREVAGLVSRDYADTEPLLIGVLKGSWVFLADLVRSITIPVIVDFVAVSSYGDRTESSGKVTFTMEPRSRIEGRDVLVVEDILDTGLTLKSVLDRLRERRPRSLRLCVLMSKPERRQTDVKPDYLGFEIPNRFVVGYGVDRGERFRNLPYVGFVEEAG